MAQHKSKDWGRGQREENSSLRAKGMPCGKNRALMSWQRAFSSREQQSRQGGDRDIHMLGDTRPQVGAESLPSTTRGRRGLREEPVGGAGLQKEKTFSFSFSSVAQSGRLSVTAWTAAHRASLSITNSRSPPKPMSVESVMPPSHLILPSPPAFSLSQHQGLSQ